MGTRKEEEFWTLQRLQIERRKLIVKASRLTRKGQLVAAKACMDLADNFEGRIHAIELAQGFDPDE